MEKERANIISLVPKAGYSEVKVPRKWPQLSQTSNHPWRVRKKQVLGVRNVGGRLELRAPARSKMSVKSVKPHVTIRPPTSVTKTMSQEVFCRKFETKDAAIQASLALMRLNTMKGLRHDGRN